jgi:hypothetical protein
MRVETYNARYKNCIIIYNEALEKGMSMYQSKGLLNRGKPQENNKTYLKWNAWQRKECQAPTLVQSQC